MVNRCIAIPKTEYTKTDDWCCVKIQKAQGILNAPDKTMHLVFYTAIHLVESKFAKTNYDSKNHGERENYMNKNRKLKIIASQYIALRNQSRLARYECCKFSKKDIIEALKYLSDIERTVSA